MLVPVAQGVVARWSTRHIAARRSLLAQSHGLASPSECVPPPDDVGLGAVDTHQCPATYERRAVRCWTSSSCWWTKSSDASSHAKRRRSCRRHGFRRLPRDQHVASSDSHAQHEHGATGSVASSLPYTITHAVRPCWRRECWRRRRVCPAVPDSACNSISRVEPSSSTVACWAKLYVAWSFRFLWKRSFFF